jgi:hypothetical protein
LGYFRVFLPYFGGISTPFLGCFWGYFREFGAFLGSFKGVLEGVLPSTSHCFTTPYKYFREFREVFSKNTSKKFSYPIYSKDLPKLPEDRLIPFIFRDLWEGRTPLKLP